MEIRLPDDPNAVVNLREIVKPETEKMDTGMVISLMIVSSMVIIILILAYSMHVFKKDKINPDLSENDHISPKKLNKHVHEETSESCNEIECSPLKMATVDKKQMIEIYSEIASMMHPYSDGTESVLAKYNLVQESVGTIQVPDSATLR